MMHYKSSFGHSIALKDVEFNKEWQEKYNRESQYAFEQGWDITEIDMRLRFKIKEIPGGAYLVEDREEKQILMTTDDLLDACVYCCGLRVMHNCENQMSPEAMYQYVQWS